MQSVLILGRQPELGLTELESLYGSDKLTLIHQKAVLLDIDPCLVSFERLGGSVKFGKVLTTLDTAEWKAIESFLIQAAPEHSKTMPTGKMRLGLSLIGFSLSAPAIRASGLRIKKVIQKTGRNVRIIPNNEAELSTAQVLHNQLTGQNGWELLCIKNGSQTVIAQTVKTQDITFYAERDRNRPKRDTKVGMLPPKLAQIILNLAVGPLDMKLIEAKCETNSGPQANYQFRDQTVLDPFCGTGVILQESYLLGYNVYGTDIDQRMIDFSQSNLSWLTKAFNLPAIPYTLERADATAYGWKQPIDIVASEVFLGRPLSTLPDLNTLNKITADCSRIITLFLHNIHPQLKKGSRVCLAVPAWQIQPGHFKHLPLIDQISNLGYNQVRFEHVKNGSLLYYRPNQIVGRELLVLSVN